jgi:hypothetical protein
MFLTGAPGNETLLRAVSAKSASVTSRQNATGRCPAKRRI